MWIMIIIIIITVSFTQGWIFKSLLQHKPSDWIWAHQAKCCCWCNLSLCWRSLGCFVAQMVGVAKCCRFHGHCRVFFFEVDLRCISLHQRAPTSIAWDFVLLFVYLRKELCSEKYSTGNLWHTHTLTLTWSNLWHVAELSFQWDLQHQFPLCCIRLYTKFKSWNLQLSEDVFFSRRRNCVPPGDRWIWRNVCHIPSASCKST